MKSKQLILVLLLEIALCNNAFGQNDSISTNPDLARFHTEDIHTFWKVFDETYPNFDADVFQQKYINQGSNGLKAFINMRIESGKNMRNTIKNNLDYYVAIRASSLSIDSSRETFYRSFKNLKEIYRGAMFPDVYFVIGARNSGGTASDNALIIGAEMFGQKTNDFSPRVDIQFIDEVIAHELIHFQQHYAEDNSLLAQCIREGSADFIGELISGGNSNIGIHQYGESHLKELWIEFTRQKKDTNWKDWLYTKSKTERPADLGYWMGYRITKSYYEKNDDKNQAIHDILNISNFEQFLQDSGFNGE